VRAEVEAARDVSGETWGRTNQRGRRAVSEHPRSGLPRSGLVQHRLSGRAWQTTVLRATGHKPVWIWRRKGLPNEKGTTKLSPKSQAAYRAVNLHFHDLRHEAGSRLLEAGWPVHHVQYMLGHASLQQTSTYLNLTTQGLHESMRRLEEARAACKIVASEESRAPRPAGKQAPADHGNLLM